MLELKNGTHTCKNVTSHPAAFSKLPQAAYLLWMAPICGSVCELAGVDMDGVVHKVGQR